MFAITRVPSLAARLSGRRFTVFLCAVFCVSLLATTSSSYSAHATPNAQAGPRVPMLFGSAPDAPDRELQAIVDETVGELDGDWGVVVKKLDTGQYAAFKPDEQHVSASLYKMWVLNELFRQAKLGMLSLDNFATVTGADAGYDASLGILRVGIGRQITLREAAYLMITKSDNTTSHLLVRTLGPENINTFMRENGLIDSYLDWYTNGDNLTTPLDVLRELEMVATSKMVDADSSRQMVDMMLDQQINDLFPPGLPQGGLLAHKTGELGGLLHDAGIVYGLSGPFVLVAMSSRLSSYATAHNNMPLLLQRVYNYFNDRPYAPTRYFPETRQSVGHEFLKFYNVYGGLEIFGFPIAPEEVIDGVLVQRFERAQMEWHLVAGQNKLLPSVVLSPLGQERADQLNLKWEPAPNNGNGQYFAETRQSVQGGFLDYWLNHGGERILGLPISPEVSMRNAANGKSYTTQYFQRARLEYHPDLPDGKRIVLGALGSELSAQP